MKSRDMFKPKGMTYAQLMEKMQEIAVFVQPDSPIIMETPSEDNFTPIESVRLTDSYMGGERCTIIHLDWRGKRG